MINSIDNTPNHPSKFKTKNWVEINDDSRGTYDSNNKNRFKTSMLKWSLCDYSGTYILVSSTITVKGGPDNATDANKRTDERNKEVIFKNCAPFIECTSEKNNTQIDYSKNLDTVMPMYNLIEYNNNYSETSESLWQYYIRLT